MEGYLSERTKFSFVQRDDFRWMHMQRNMVVVGNVPSQPKNSAWKNGALNGAKSGKKGTGNRSEIDLRNLKSITCPPPKRNHPDDKLTLTYHDGRTIKLVCNDIRERKIWMEQMGVFVRDTPIIVKHEEGAVSPVRPLSPTGMNVPTPTTSTSTSTSTSIPSVSNTIAIPASMERAIHTCLAWILQHGVDAEGIFRVASPQADVSYLLNQLLVADASIPSTMDPYVVANTCKVMLRRLPESILTNEMFPLFITHATAKNDEHIVALMQTLPTTNYRLFAHVIHTCYMASLNAESKMSATSLAVVVGPTFLPTEDASVLMHLATTMTPLFEALFRIAAQTQPSTHSHSTSFTFDSNDKTATSTTSRSSSKSFFSPMVTFHLPTTPSPVPTNDIVSPSASSASNGIHSPSTSLSRPVIPPRPSLPASLKRPKSSRSTSASPTIASSPPGRSPLSSNTSTPRSPPSVPQKRPSEMKKSPRHTRHRGKSQVVMMTNANVLDDIAKKQDDVVNVDDVDVDVDVDMDGDGDVGVDQEEKKGGENEEDDKVQENGTDEVNNEDVKHVDETATSPTSPSQDTAISPTSPSQDTATSRTSTSLVTSDIQSDISPTDDIPSPTHTSESPRITVTCVTHDDHIDPATTSLDTNLSPPIPRVSISETRSHTDSVTSMDETRPTSRSISSTSTSTRNSPREMGHSSPRSTRGSPRDARPSLQRQRSATMTSDTSNKRMTSSPSSASSTNSSPNKRRSRPSHVTMQPPPPRVQRIKQTFEDLSPRDITKEKSLTSRDTKDKTLTSRDNTKETLTSRDTKEKTLSSDTIAIMKRAAINARIKRAATLVVSPTKPTPIPITSSSSATSPVTGSGHVSGSTTPTDSARTDSARTRNRVAELIALHVEREQKVTSTRKPPPLTAAERRTKGEAAMAAMKLTRRVADVFASQLQNKKTTSTSTSPIPSSSMPPPPPTKRASSSDRMPPKSGRKTSDSITSSSPSSSPALVRKASTSSIDSQPRRRVSSAETTTRTATPQQRRISDMSRDKKNISPAPTARGKRSSPALLALEVATKSGTNVTTIPATTIPTTPVTPVTETVATELMANATTDGAAATDTNTTTGTSDEATHGAPTESSSNAPAPTLSVDTTATTHSHDTTSTPEDQTPIVHVRRVHHDYHHPTHVTAPIPLHPPVGTHLHFHHAHHPPGPSPPPALPSTPPPALPPPPRSPVHTGTTAQAPMHAPIPAHPSALNASHAIHIHTSKLASHTKVLANMGIFKSGNVEKSGDGHVSSDASESHTEPAAPHNISPARRATPPPLPHKDDTNTTGAIATSPARRATPPPLPHKDETTAAATALSPSRRATPPPLPHKDDTAAATTTASPARRATPPPLPNKDETGTAVTAISPARRATPPPLPHKDDTVPITTTASPTRRATPPPLPHQDEHASTHTAARATPPPLPHKDDTAHVAARATPPPLPPKHEEIPMARSPSARMDEIPVPIRSPSNSGTSTPTAARATPPPLPAKINSPIQTPTATSPPSTSPLLANTRLAARATPPVPTLASPSADSTVPGSPPSLSSGVQPSSNPPTRPLPQPRKVASIAASLERQTPSPTPSQILAQARDALKHSPRDATDNQKSPSPVPSPTEKVHTSTTTTTTTTASKPTSPSTSKPTSTSTSKATSPSTSKPTSTSTSTSTSASTTPRVAITTSTPTTTTSTSTSSISPTKSLISPRSPRSPREIPPVAHSSAEFEEQLKTYNQRHAQLLQQHAELKKKRAAQENESRSGASTAREIRTGSLSSDNTPRDRSQTVRVSGVTDRRTVSALPAGALVFHLPSHHTRSPRDITTVAPSPRDLTAGAPVPTEEHVNGDSKPSDVLSPTS